MALRVQASAFVPLKLAAEIEREVVLIEHFVAEILVFPVHYTGSSQFPEVELHFGCNNLFAIKRPCT
jgi:hypothetical protein